MILKFSPADRITIGNYQYRYVETDPRLGYLFARADLPAHTQFFTDDDFARFDGDTGYRLDLGWYDPQAARTRALTNVSHISDLPHDDQELILHRLDLIHLFRADEEAGLATRSDESIADFLPRAYATLAFRSHGGSRKRRFKKKKIAAFDTICPRTFRRYLCRFEGSEGDPRSVQDRTWLCGNRKDRFSTDVRNAIDIAVASYATEKRATKRHCYRDVLTPAILKLNAERAALGLPARSMPSFGAFSASVSARSDFWITAGRKGVSFAEAKWAMVSQGVDAIRPCQRWEMDSWTVDLMTILGVGDHEILPDDVKQSLKIRLNLCVCIDVASRCIVGMRLSRTPKVDNALRTLEMAVSRNKARFANLSDCVTPWDMCGVPQILATDTGNEFLHRLQVAAVDLGISPYLPPAKRANQRPYIERLFGTFKTRALVYFTGQTFGNTQLLGDYPAQQQASLNPEALADVLTRWVVDDYHNTPHAGLYNETPRNAWLRLTKLFQIVPPPDRHKRRAIFGLQMDRALTAEGVTVCRLHYQSLEIQKLRRDDDDRMVSVKIDVMDVGRISVWDGAGWHTVNCSRDDMDDVSLDDWLAALADLRRRHAKEETLSADVVQSSVRDIKRIAADCERRESIRSLTPTIEDIIMAEAMMKEGYSMPLASQTAPDTGVVASLRQRAVPAQSSHVPVNQTPPKDSTYEIED